MPGGYPLGLELVNGTSIGASTSTSLGTPVTCGSSAYGSFAQIVAATQSDTCWAFVTLQTIATAGSASFQQSVNIAVGSSGNEKVIINNLMILAVDLGAYTSTYAFPISIPAGSRISAQGFCVGGTDTVNVALILFDGAFTQMEGASGVDSLGWSAGQGTTITTGAANTKGSFAQLIAATARDYMGFILSCDDLNNSIASPTADSFLIDVAIGASGNEKVIVPNYPSGLISSGSSFGVDYEGTPTPFIPLPIKAGTRVAVRAQDIAGSKTIGATLYGVYQ